MSEDKERNFRIAVGKPQDTETFITPVKRLCGRLHSRGRTSGWTTQSWTDRKQWR